MPGMKLKALDLEGKVIEEGIYLSTCLIVAEKVIKVLGKHGLDRIVLNEGIAGDIISICGFSKATVTQSLVDPEINEPIKVK